MGAVKEIKWKKVGGILLAVSLALQIWDMKPIMRGRDGYKTPVEYQSICTQPIWGKLSDHGIRHLFLTNTMFWTQNEVYPLAEYALKRGITLNFFTLAHLNVIPGDPERLDTDTAYILPGDIPIENCTSELVYYRADGFTIGVKNPVEGELPAR